MARRRFKKSAEVHAGELGISETQARRYLQEGMPEAEPARSAWVNARADKRRGGDEDSETAKLHKAYLAAKTRRVLLQNEQLAARNAKERGELVRLADVTQQLAGLAAACRNGFRQLGSRAIPRLLLAKTAAEMDAILVEEIDAILLVLADERSEPT